MQVCAFIFFVHVSGRKWSFTACVPTSNETLCNNTPTEYTSAMTNRRSLRLSTYTQHLRYTCINRKNIDISYLQSHTPISVVKYMHKTTNLTKVYSSQFSCHTNFSDRWSLKSINNGGPGILVGMKGLPFSQH